MLLLDNYNLIDTEWIPVLYKNGDYKRVGIKKAFQDAQIIRQIATSNPMDRVSIIRFLIAVFYWCRGNPTENKSEMIEKIQEEWLEKLNANRDYFNLFGKEKRFFQYGGYAKGKDKFLSVSSLIHEIPTGTSIWHFRHSRDEHHGLCPDCCAIGLLRLPVFTTQGGAGKAPGINLKPPIYIIPIGNSLLETIMSSYKNVEELGIPSWEKTDMQIQETGKIDFLSGLTALPRRVWLTNPEYQGHCTCCGRNKPIITKCVYSGVRQRSKESPIEWQDPHIVYFLDKKETKSSKTDNPLKKWFKTDRPWTKLMCQIYESGKFTEQEYFIVGFASDQVKYIDVWERTIKISNASNSEKKLDFLNKWDEAASKLPQLIRVARRKHKGNERSILRNIRPQIEYEIANEFLSNKENIQEPWVLAGTKFKKMMKVVARSLSPGSISKDINRMNAISNIVPKINIKEQESKKNNDNN